MYCISNDRIQDLFDSRSLLPARLLYLLIIIGIKIDWTAPGLKITELGRKKGGDPYIDPPPGENIYQFDPTTLVAEWLATDLQSGIADAYYTVGKLVLS